MIVKVFIAFWAVLFSGIIFNAPKKLLVYIGALGALGWTVYLLVLDSYGASLATFASSVVIAFTAHLAARYSKTAVTIYFLPAFFPLVPGVSMYRSVHYYFTRDTSLGQYYLLDALATAGMIALAIFAVDSLFLAISQFRKAS